MALRELRREAALLWDVASKIWAGVWLLLLGPAMLLFTSLRDEWGVVIYFAWIILGAATALVVGRRPKRVCLYLGPRRMPIVIEAADIFSAGMVSRSSLSTSISTGRLGIMSPLAAFMASLLTVSARGCPIAGTAFCETVWRV